MKARDVMSQAVISVPPDATVEAALRLMVEKNISGLPVIDAAGQLVGIVSEGDFLRRAELGTQPRQPRWIEFLMGPGALAEQYVRASGRKVGEIMTAPVRSVAEDTPLDDVVMLMERYHIKRVPVMRGERPVGIITRANLIRALASVSRELAPTTAGDSEIRERIVKAIRELPWGPGAMVQVLVREGVVTFTGSVFDERQRRALHVLAENTAGVKGMRDHMVWIEPMSGMVIESDEDRAGD
ncbi:MAG: CBS domain-containing protein [Pseudorhodoplanes sp.]|nr:hypothetical protein [Pseudorhodoplanes sp.]MBW7949678.1 CBS domain-containing protein [Pseudorhodoplanes sp.]MCL4711429.1 CBS domain-containing protein [Pseudorhodoplanes sp.]MCQ3942037.1 hypothetical protein [Alphaproteobacteria bacterium]GIK79167.1 MAG: hypothetical protein BroJett024_02720 [Alphaproteobacteria bacterium]